MNGNETDTRIKKIHERQESIEYGRQLQNNLESNQEPLPTLSNKQHLGTPHLPKANKDNLDNYDD